MNGQKKINVMLDLLLVLSGLVAMAKMKPRSISSFAVFVNEWVVIHQNEKIPLA